jgi:hypothetical protein
MLLSKDSLMFALLDPRPVRAMLHEHRSRKQDNHKVLFSLAMLEQWMRIQRSRSSSLVPAAAN